MILINKKNLIEDVAERWCNQYYYNGNWSKTYNGDSEEVYNEIKNIDKNLSIKYSILAINKIIGNNGWTKNECDECGKDVNISILLCHDPDVFNLCKKCLNKALKKL